MESIPYELRLTGREQGLAYAQRGIKEVRVPVSPQAQR